MTGKIFKPGKDKEGKFLDTAGTPDKRLAVMSTDFKFPFYKVVKDEQELHELFDEAEKV